MSLSGGGSLGSQVGYNLNDGQDREDRRKHLEFVQAVVTRMAGVSTSVKGWAVTVAAGAFGVAVVRGSWFVFLLGVGALVTFGILDGLYLHTEKKYRDLHEAIVQNAVEPLSMETKNLKVRRSSQSHRSWSVVGFYVPLAVAGLILMGVSVGRGDSQQQQQQPPSQRPNVPTQVSPSPSSVAPVSPSANPTTAAPASTPAATTVPEVPPSPRAPSR